MIENIAIAADQAEFNRVGIGLYKFMPSVNHVSCDNTSEKVLSQVILTSFYERTIMVILP